MIVPLRITFFSGDISRSGGTERVGVTIANALAAEGYAVSFVSLFEEFSEPFFMISESIARRTIYATPTHGIQHWFSTVHRLRRFIKELHTDVLVDIDGILDMYSLPAAMFTSMKVISWEHFNYHQNPLVPYRKLTRRWAARSASAIVTLTKADAEFYAVEGHPRCPIVTIPNPVTELDEPVRYNNQSRLIISSGRLTAQKGFDMLVDAAAKVLSQHADWHWLILGEGEDRPMLERKIAAVGLGEQLILKGRVEHMGDYYRKAAMFVLSSRFEGLPMVLLEAKGYRLPIVSFDCETGPAEMVEDGVNGDLVKLGDIDALADRVNRLIDHAELRQRYSNHALDGMERFRKAAIIGQWNALLEGLR